MGARFRDDPFGIQKLVGYGAGAVGVVVAILNLLIIAIRHPGQNLVDVITGVYVWGPAACGLFFALGGRIHWVGARWIQVLVFFAAAILAAITSRVGDLTSSPLLVFALALLAEHALPRTPAIIVGVAGVVVYLFSLAVGYAGTATNLAASYTESLMVILLLILLYGGILHRHALQHKKAAEELEDRVAQRTKDLSSALDERVVMLQEIHHRVKNNLQVIGSLLSLESQRATQEDAKRVADDTIRRVHAMALVHETLYQNEPFHLVDLGGYTRKLVSSLSITLSSLTRLSVEVEGGADVNPDFAIPFGMIVSELVSNSARHAFPSGRRGTIRVHVDIESPPRTGNGEYVTRRASRVNLRVGDDGVGMPENPQAVAADGGLRESNGSSSPPTISRREGGNVPTDAARGGLSEGGQDSSGLGLQIVRALVRQLSGTFDRSPSNAGTEWNLSFPVRYGS